MPEQIDPAMGEVKQLVTKENFTQWTKDCGVKCIQKQYDEMAIAAVKNGRSLQEEMQSRGHKDFHNFSKSCPKFRLGSWPIEFAELGSGYVLYFQFLAFLMLIFLVHAGLQVPCMVVYAGSSNLVDWSWHEWTKAYSTDSSACDCVGNSSGYAATCGTWDYDLCRNQSDCAFNETGKWICQSWCYAGKYCPKTDTGVSASMVNVHIHDGSSVLVKSYSSCTQDETLIAQCEADFRSANTAYSGPDVDTGKDRVWIGQHWLSPGNLGPDEATNVIIPTMYTVCVISMCVLILMAYSSQVLTDYKVDAGTTSPNDFAIMVKGLPSTATDEESIMEFFKEHAVKGKTDTEIVKVVIGWDIDEWRENIARLKDLKKRLDATDRTTPEAQEIQKEMVQITSALKSAGTKDAKLRSSGVVVVVFRYQSDMRACLKKWDSFWANWFNCASSDIGFLWKDNGICKGEPLPRFPIGGRPIAKLSAARAANPGDIHWAELAVPQGERIKRLAITNGVMFLLVAACFGAVYGLRIAAMAVKESAGSGGVWLSLLPAFVVAIVNGLLMAAARMLGDKEFHDTLTEQEFSQAAKMSVGMVVNTAGVLYFIYATPSEWYQDGGLVNGAFTMLLINAIVPPIVPYLDLGYKIRGNIRGKLEDRLPYFNEVLTRGPNPKDPEQMKELKAVKAEIEAFKRAYTPGTMNPTRRYASAIKTFVCCLLYQPVFPLISLVGLAGLGAQYWMDKYLLLGWYSRPRRPLNADIANFFVRFVKLVGPIGLSVSFFVFLTPSFADKNAVLGQFIISIVTSAIFSLVFPLSVWIRCWLSMPCREDFKVQEHEDDYYQAQYMWSKEMKYHKDQFIYKNLPEDKNPEFLKPGESTAVSATDMKATFGVSAGAVADDAADGPAKIALKGGRVVPSEPTIGGSVGGGPAPVVIGAVEPTIPASGTTTAEDDRPTVPLVSGGGGLPHTPEPGRTPGRVIWEFEWKGHFSAYDGDCQDYMEKKYQEYQSGGGRSRVNVRTKGIQISVDFSKMSSKRDGSDHIQKIRRKETE